MTEHDLRKCYSNRFKKPRCRRSKPPGIERSKSASQLTTAAISKLLLLRTFSLRPGARLGETSALCRAGARRVSCRGRLLQSSSAYCSQGARFAAAVETTRRMPWSHGQPASGKPKASRNGFLACSYAERRNERSPEVNISCDEAPDV